MAMFWTTEYQVEPYQLLYHYSWLRRSTSSRQSTTDRWSTDHKRRKRRRATRSVALSSRSRRRRTPLYQGPCPPLPLPGGSSTIDVHAAFVLCIENTSSPRWLCTRRWDYHDIDQWFGILASEIFL